MKKHIISELFEAYQLPLYRYLLQMSRSKETAEDLLQETFYRAIISLKVKNMLQAKAWLFKVARNLYIDSTRKGTTTERKLMCQLKQNFTPSSSIGNPEQALDKKNRQEELEAVLGMLPEKMQTILYLREVQGFTYKELTIAMDLTESQVKVTLHRAREKFRNYETKLREGDENNERR